MPTVRLAESPDDLVVTIQSRRQERVFLFQQLQHAFPALVLFPDGLQRIANAPHGLSLALAIGEIVTSVLVAGSVVRALRRVRAKHVVHEHHGVDWLDVFLSAMLVTEALVHRHETGHLPRPILLSAATMLMLGLLHGRMLAFRMRRRALRITEEGLTIGGKFFTRFTARWAEIATIDMDAAQARILTKDGRERKINLADSRNASGVTDALQIAKARQARALGAPSATA